MSDGRARSRARLLDGFQFLRTLLSYFDLTSVYTVLF